MKKFALAAAAALTAGTFGIAAIAQDSNSSTAFDDADANGDNSISWEEALAGFPGLTQSTFDTADANDDGGLDEGEYGSLQVLAQGLEPVTDNNADVSSQSSVVTDSSESSAVSSESSAVN